jgi:hypothetical protein
MVARALSQVSEYDEVLLYTRPRLGPGAEAPGPPGIRTTRYHGWLYTTLALPVALPDLASLPFDAAPPAEMCGLPLAGHEDLTIHWRSYAEYLAAFYAGDEGLLRLRAFLEDSLSTGLLHLIQAPPTGSRWRVWWVNDAPELEDLPWESISLGASRPERLSVVRGRPPASVPPLPLPPGRPLQIALIDPGGRAPPPVRRALADLGPALAVVRRDGTDPREALCEAARGGAEIVHLIADGSVPLGVEGLLDFPGGATLMPAELSHLLHGSRVALVSLSAPAQPRTDRAGLPTVFHGFARFGRAIGDGPTVLAPLGPIAPAELEQLWRQLYRRFADTLDVEDALAAATPHPLRAPLVLFLRQRFGRQFSRGADDGDDPDDWDDVSFDPGSADPPSAAQASADLATSGDLLDAVTELQGHYAKLGDPFPGQELVDKERDRQRALAAHVDGALLRRRSR